MRKLLAILICLPLFTTAQQTINGSITHGGLQRDYIIHIPSSYNVNTPIPLVFCFHGYTSSASTIMSYTNFNYATKDLLLPTFEQLFLPYLKKCNSHQHFSTPQGTYSNTP